MRLLVLLPAFVLILSLVDSLPAQLPKVGRDYRQPMTYDPSDPFEKGYIYRLHTGQAGRFFNCDGEEEKRYSPYIHWETVCNHDRVRPYGQVLRADIREVQRRVKAGACRCPSNCTCSECQSSNSPIEAGPTPADTTGIIQAARNDGSTDIESRLQDDHVVYGSRESRRRQLELSEASKETVRK